MSHPMVLAAIVAGAGVVACLGTFALIPVLRRAAVLDRPNERSSHLAPTPRGGGIAVVVAILFAWLALTLAGAYTMWLGVVMLGGALLAAVSWIDDLRGLPPAVRLLAQFVAVGAGMVVLAPLGSVFPLLQSWPPSLLDRIAAALLWVWFINLFNFMDGIDGIAGGEAAAIAIGLAIFAGFGVSQDWSYGPLAAVVAAAALGFLVWNWAPARIFLGDVGSVPLGYLLGFLLLNAAARGHWKIALILPLYFLADATVTLLRRLARGERVWRPHRQHFYQRAVQRGLSHAGVVWRVIAANAILIACGWAAENGAGIPALILAAATVLVLLASLAGIPRRSAGSA
jgi:UDP-N-acetylmuramyl pentapeptide phosphotransferase/UDP-N-acetylglucosamine-1-phosphate transferase